jgi:hypothetical protein
MKYSPLILLLTSILTKDCSTPKECFQTAADELGKAKEDYFLMLDKVYKLAGSFKPELLAKLAEDAPRVQNITDNQANLTESITAFQTSTNTTLSNVISDLNNLTCRNVETPCGEVRHGNMQFLDRHKVFCGKLEFMKGWHLQSCDNNDVKIQYTCCTHN